MTLTFIPMSYANEVGVYQLNPGDELEIAVWGDDDLQRKVVVLPDGSITFPLIGRLNVRRLTSTEVEKELANRLEHYVPEPQVTVTIISPSGHRIYLVGKVQTPGAYMMSSPMSVIQALSFGGSFGKFADTKNILIIRKDNNQEQYFKFNYSKVASGKSLESNIILQPGDVIVVP
jgi:polysaccharide export outer membrane protein